MVLYILYRMGIFLALNVPLKVGYKIATFLAIVKYTFSPRDRRYIQKNLRIALSQKSDEEIARLSRQAFINFAKYLVDFFRFSKIDARYIEKNVLIKNRGYIDEALSHKKGVILVGAHIGNWELAAAVVAALGYKLNVVALNHSYKKINDFFIGQRNSKGITVIPVGMAVRRCFDVLRKNEVLGMLGDRDFTNHGFKTIFFGKKAIIPKGPAAFSLKTGAPLISR